MRDVVRIGCWAAFWGDTPAAARQLLGVADLHYLVADYLSEITMALLARKRNADPAAGFIDEAAGVLAPLLPEISRRGIKVVTNAGALNPHSLATVLREAAASAGLPLTVAAVSGDDQLPRLAELRERCPADMFTGDPFPERVDSLNAYLGAAGIAAALGAGADIVVTGRCTDAAVVLGPLIHEFGWQADDYDLLAAGTLVGHIVECGPQCTGGNHTDWSAVPGWDDMGYPVAEVSADGSAVITKPAGTGGLVSPATVSEQILYEIGDPGAYLTPEVVCDWREVRAEMAGPDRVRVSGAKGSPPTTTYKCTATVTDGWRVLVSVLFVGHEAAGRARRAAEASVARAARLVAEQGFEPFAEISVELMGAGESSGRPDDTAREVVVKIGLRHRSKEPLELYGRELASLALVAQGMTGLYGGRPHAAPVVKVMHMLADREAIEVTYDLGQGPVPVDVAPGDPRARTATPELPDPEPTSTATGRTVPLVHLAYARSGDKGNSANVGVIARRPEYLPLLRDQVTCERVAQVFAPYAPGEVRRWELPGLSAINFLLTDVLGGAGGTSTLRFDPQGKSYAAMLLDLPVQIPDDWP